MMLTKTKIINPKKTLRFICITLLLVTTLVFAIKTSANGSVKESYTVITVCPGDTLWEIARNQNRGSNIQKLIYEIMQANNMVKSDIYSGQMLKIPAK